jgi:DNA-binding SARP family transcriptional activator
MHVRLLGAFVAEIDGREIEWLRRRDRQVFKYLTLSPHGSASRAELKELFWPGCRQPRIAQRLRTVCSNIRKAIGNAAGEKHVDNYFHCNEYLAIDRHNVVIDANTFMLYIDTANAEYAHGRLRSAYADYRKAVRLYQGDLLVGYAEEAWVEPRASALEARYAIALDRIAERFCSRISRAARSVGNAIARQCRTPCSGTTR